MFSNFSNHSKMFQDCFSVEFCIFIPYFIHYKLLSGEKVIAAIFSLCLQTKVHCLPDSAFNPLTQPKLRLRPLMGSIKCLYMQFNKKKTKSHLKYTKWVLGNLIL